MIFNLVKKLLKTRSNDRATWQKTSPQNGVSRQRGAIHAAESPNNEKQS